MRRSRVVLALLFGLAGSATAAPHPRLSVDEAKKIALAKVPGTVVHDKLKEKKNHALYYIKIRPKDAAKSSTTLKKVEVDGDSGAIVKIKDVKGKGDEKDE
jgi:uncharacterized membrane protein YkoI